MNKDSIGYLVAIDACGRVSGVLTESYLSSLQAACMSVPAGLHAIAITRRSTPVKRDMTNVTKMAHQPCSLLGE
jgi:hypothetical protein